MFLDLMQIIEIQKSWKLARKSNEEFVREIKQEYPNLAIGATFIPEKLQSYGYSDQQILENFDYIVQKLGIKEIRIGLRFTSIDFTKKNLGIFKDILDYSFDNDVKLTLNVGPIKVCGWPEYHIPSDLTDSCSIPQKGGKVECESDLAQQMRTKLEILLDMLSSSFTPKQLETIYAFQPENEGFFQFGQFAWSIDSDHIKKSIKIISDRFPLQKILLNTPELHYAQEIIDLGSSMPKNTLILGMDYYYAIGDLGRFRIAKTVDQTIFSTKKGAMSFRNVKQICHEKEISTEVTELQMEPWGKSSEPGNSVKSLKYGLKRCTNILLNNRQVVRVWGIEQLAAHDLQGTATEEHEQMIELIRMINGIDKIEKTL